MELIEFVGKFFGSFQIKKVEKLEGKSHLDKERVKLTFEGNKTHELPLEVLENCVTDKQSDLTALRERQVNPVAELILDFLAEHELGREDIFHLLNTKLPESIRLAREKAESLIFNKEPEDVSLYDLEKIFQEKENV